MNTAVAVVVILVGMIAQVAPVMAAAADGGNGGSIDLAAWFTGFRDVLNVGLVSVISWAIRWAVVNVGPRLIKMMDLHNELIGKLELSVDRIETNHGIVVKQLTELHQSCANWKPTK